MYEESSTTIGKACRDACSICVHGIGFTDETRTYWCRARKEKIDLKTCTCLWENVCKKYTLKKY